MVGSEAIIAERKRPIGCPSGLQSIPIADEDPNLSNLNLSAYVMAGKDYDHGIDLIIQGAHCAGCRNKIETRLMALSFIRVARLNLSTLRLHVEWEGQSNRIDEIVQTLSAAGYGVALYDAAHDAFADDTHSRALLRAMAVAGFAMMNVMILSISVWSGGDDMSLKTRTLFHWISALIALPTIAYSGQVFFRSASAALRAGRTNMDVPISLALLLACGLSIYETVNGNRDTYFDAAVMLVFLLLIGRYLDARLRLKTGEAARNLAALQSRSATRILANGRIETVPTRQIQLGDRLLIPAGQRIPVDCEIVKGRSDIDVQIVTGETAPQSLAEGETLFSGTINLTNPLEAIAIAIHSQSFLADITALVEAGEQSKNRYVRIADRAARAYVPLVHTIASLTFVGWMWISGDFRTAALHAIAVLIITCPCALGLAVPAVQIVASGRLFKAGVLIKSGDALERLADITEVIFDKTGTLTTGRFTLVNEAEISPLDLGIAAAMAQYSRHPLSQALHCYDANQDVQDVEAYTGSGLSADHKDKTVKFGSARWLGLAENEDDSQSQVFLQIGGAVPQIFRFKDTLRPEVKDVVNALSLRGVPMTVLSGDRKNAVSTISKELGIANAMAEVTPQQKLLHIQDRMQSGARPLMIGDGINDAPALAAGQASMSMAAAADISRAASDIILQRDSLKVVPFAIDMAKLARRRVIQNLSCAALYNICAIPLAIFGFVNPLIAALAMSGSSLFVTLNALRMPVQQGGRK